MKLTDLDPTWVSSGGEGITDKDGNPVSERTGVGIMFDCPCQKDAKFHRVYVPFTNPISGGNQVDSSDNRDTWERTGDTFETLTLSPSILRNPKHGGCGWHGFVRNGNIITC